MNLIVRPFEDHEFDTWYPLWRGYQGFYKVDIPPETSRTTWQRLLDRSEPMHGAFAVDGGHCVGIVHFIEHRSCWTSGNYMYLQDLFVDSSCRGRGIGRALIEHVYQEARQRCCSRVHWLTHETNTEAMRLYDRLAERSGFVQYRKILQDT